MMVKTLPIVLAFVLISGPALAAQYQMECKNPRQTYVATFDDDAPSFKIETAGSATLYEIERIEKDGNGQIVRGKTVSGGPYFVAHLGGKKRIEFIDGDQVIQTDPCD